MLYRPVLLVLLPCFIPAAFAADAPASIRGVVSGDDGKPIAGAVVQAVKAGSQGSAVTGTDGAFRIDGLAASRYDLCVTAADVVNRCLWELTPDSVTVAAGQVVTGSV